MRAVVFIFLFCFFFVECRKVVPIDKNANTAFINMEAGGGGTKSGGTNSRSSAVQSPTPAPGAQTGAPSANAVPPTQPKLDKPVVTPKPTLPPKPVEAPKTPSQIKPVPVNPPPAINPLTTPGPGTVQQLITFYDRQGKGSPIRPYSYSQAVKQG